MSSLANPPFDIPLKAGAQRTFHARTWWALAPALVVPTLGTLIFFVFLAGSDAGKAMMMVTKVFGVAWPLLATVFLIRRPLRMPVIPHPVRDIAIGALSGVAIGALMMGLAWFSPLSGYLEGAAAVIEKSIADLGFANYFLLLALGISFLNSAMEEYYWRWFVYGNLRTVLKSKWLPHFFAALAFTGHHLVVTTLLFPLPFALFLCFGVFVGGLIWSFFYQKQGHLWGAWVSHILADLAIFYIAWKAMA